MAQRLSTRFDGSAFCPKRRVVATILHLKRGGRALEDR